jgi:CRISPR-associated protein Csd2
MAEPIQNRYEFVYYFDVENGNPNGDPDAGNMPRIDFETNHGLVTDVCLKRKVRNFVEIAAEEPGREIYVKEKAVLNQQHQRAYDAEGLTPDTQKNRLPKDADKARAVTQWMCANFFDVRSFGAVMTTEVNAGQVRGPVQFTFARSLDPILPQEVSVTRMAVTNERDLEKERTMGRKAIVPYALYRAEGFISAPLAEKTGFAEDDLELFWQALAQMFDHDRSAARGKMAARELIVFRHDSKLGKAPAQTLFDAVSESRTSDGPPRGFGDYSVRVDHDALPGGVTVLRPFRDAAA